jgi:NAD(P)-dependent dehydrogenase (short-subunit alcohol dehydrogenase family)
MSSVNDKVVLITGGARGVGAEVARRLHDKGANLVLTDLDEAPLKELAADLGADRVLTALADVRDLAAMQAAVDQGVERFGGIDIVIANAGISPSPGTVRVMEASDFERVVEVNLLGVYRTIHAGLEQVVARRGQTVLVSSVYAFANGIMASPYAVAKAGVEQLGRALRLELAPHGASATVAYFGWVDTKMVQDAFAVREEMRGEENELLPGFLRKRISPQRAGEALARGIERRLPRVIEPRWWAGPSTLRGILGPLMDFAGARSSRVGEEVRRAEAAAQAPDRPS